MKATDGLHLSPTPLVPVRLTEDGPTVWCKCEFMNPSGSTKDRIAAFILSKAWRDGVVQRGDVVVEVSSGSTSIAMAMVCARLGLQFIAIMPEGVSRERILMIQGFGGAVSMKLGRVASLSLRRVRFGCAARQSICGKRKSR